MPVPAGYALLDVNGSVEHHQLQHQHQHEPCHQAGYNRRPGYYVNDGRMGKGSGPSNTLTTVHHLISATEHSQ